MRGGSDGDFDDPEYYETIKNGAAGVFFVCIKSRRILLALRSEWVETPFHWSGFGGAIGHGESPEAAARREIGEEAGYHGEYQLIPVFKFTSPTFSYQNYVALVDHEFMPQLNWENTEAAWFNFAELPHPLHPGMKMCLADALTKKTVQSHLGLNENVNELLRNPKNIDPALMTFSEYRAVVDAQRKTHASSAYDESLKQLNAFFNIAEYPKVLRNLRVNGLSFTVRLRAEKAHYVKERTDSEVVYFTDTEVKSLGYSAFQYSIAIVDQDNQRVASLQDEWGCVLVVVAREFRGFGFGKLLINLAYTIEPAKPSGGFTESGFHTFRKVYRDFVSSALSSGRYRELMLSGTLTMDRVKEIVTSANLTERPVTKPPRNLNHRDPRDWLLFGSDTTFVLYDRKLKDHVEEDHWGDTMVKGMIHFGIIERGGRNYGIIYSFGGDRPAVKTLMLRCAASVCAEENATLMVDEDDIIYIDPKYLTQGPVTLTTGYKRAEVSLAEPFDPAPMAAQEAAYRRSFDRYDEFYNTLLSMADSKYRHSINEVKDDSAFPIRDNFGNSSIDTAIMSAPKKKLIKIADINGYQLWSRDWPLTETHEHRLYLFDGETPIGMFDIIERSHSDQQMYQTYYSYIRPEYRHKGLGYAIYSFLLNEGYTLCSGKTHTTDSKLLWAKLSKNFKVTMDGEPIKDTSDHYGTSHLFIAHPRTDQISMIYSPAVPGSPARTGA